AGDAWANVRRRPGQPAGCRELWDGSQYPSTTCTPPSEAPARGNRTAPAAPWEARGRSGEDAAGSEAAMGPGRPVAASPTFVALIARRLALFTLRICGAAGVPLGDEGARLGPGDSEPSVLDQDALHPARPARIEGGRRLANGRLAPGGVLGDPDDRFPEGD